MTTTTEPSTQTSPGIRRVVFVQKFVPHYRLPLFERLRDRLAEKGIEFILIYGQPDPYEGSKIKMEYPAWGRRVKSLIIGLPGKFTRYLYWQGVPFKVKRHDVVIVEHASKLLDNYFLFLMQQIGWISMCYFGHGRNFQSHREISLARKTKRLMVKRVAKWFAYTDISRVALLEQEVPPERITVVNNTLVENKVLLESEVARNTGQFVYIGGMYKEKRIDLILEALQQLIDEGREISLYLAGTGPEQPMVEKFSQDHPWCHYLGPIYGEQRDRLLFESSAILMPGPVGLVAIDSFHYATPILTATLENHGPEVAYLEHEKNALIMDKRGNASDYKALIQRFLDTPGLAEQLQAGCRASAGHYTIDETAKNFVDGIMSLQP